MYLELLYDEVMTDTVFSSIKMFDLSMWSKEGERSDPLSLGRVVQLGLHG